MAFYKDMSDIKTEQLFGRFECIAMSRIWTLYELYDMKSHKFSDVFIKPVLDGNSSSIRICNIWDYAFFLVKKEGNLYLMIEYIDQHGIEHGVPREYVKMFIPSQISILTLVEEKTQFYSKSKEIMRRDLVNLLSKDIPIYKDKKIVWGKASWFIKNTDMSLPHCFIIKDDRKLLSYKMILQPGGFTDYFAPGENLKRVEKEFKFNPLYENWKQTLTECISKCIDEVLYALP